MYEAEAQTNIAVAASAAAVATTTDGADESRAAAEEENLTHQMRCLEALGRWPELNTLSETALNARTHGASMSTMSAEIALPGGAVESPLRIIEKNQRVAIMAARSCWALGEAAAVFFLL